MRDRKTPDSLNDDTNAVLERFDRLSANGSWVGAEADAVACPNGDFSETVIKASARAGYRLGFTTEARHARKTDRPLALPRILVGRRDTPPVLAARLAGWQEWLKGC
jgi:hypothetical protein